MLVVQLVSLTLLAERQQAAIARNEPVDPNWVIQGTHTILRLLSELGFDAAKRRRKQRHPTGHPRAGGAAAARARVAGAGSRQARG